MKRWQEDDGPAFTTMMKVEIGIFVLGALAVLASWLK